jgi:hypothetical protein
LPRMTDEERISNRAKKISLWLEHSTQIENEVYSDLLSRREETASLSGFHTPSQSDPGPRTRPCECRVRWQRGRLCLACDNSGWRRCAPGEEGIDPYSAQVPKRGSFLLIEADSTKKAAAQQRMDAQIDMLERFERIRAGLEANEDRELRAFRMVNSVGLIHTIKKIEEALRLLLHYRPAALTAPREALARALAYLVQGRVYWPPGLAPEAGA